MPGSEAEEKAAGRLQFGRAGGIPTDTMDEPRSESRKLLQWVQKQAGVSRRKAEELIEAGEVRVNDAVITDPWLSLDRSEIERLSLRGHPLSPDAPEPRVYRFHKPPGMLCSHDDPFYGNTVGRILRTEGFIGYTWVGRLDQDAEGLLLLTNAGDLVHRFTHPRYEVEKSYHVWLDRTPSRKEAQRVFHEMKRGIEDQGDRLRIESGRFEGRPAYAVIRLTEGKKHEIKRLFAHFDLQVKRLLRVAIGPVTLGSLPPGVIERLSEQETAEIFRSIR